MCGVLTSEYVPFRSASVNTLPSWSTSWNDPPTFGLPTALFASAMRFFCMRPFSYSKYHIMAPAVATNNNAAFQEKGCEGGDSPLSAFRHVGGGGALGTGGACNLGWVFAYPYSILALCLLNRLVFEAFLDQRLASRVGLDRSCDGGSLGCWAVRRGQKSATLLCGCWEALEVPQQSP